VKVRELADIGREHDLVDKAFGDERGHVVRALLITLVLAESDVVDREIGARGGDGQQGGDAPPVPQVTDDL
jgi:hypothetical protein